MNFQMYQYKSYMCKRINYFIKHVLRLQKNEYKN